MSEKNPGRPKSKDLIRLKDCPAIIKEITGVDRSEESVYYWATKGLTSNHGVRLKLRTTNRIRMIYTTRKWLEDFLRGVQ